MSQRDDHPHLRHMFTHFVTKRGLPPPGLPTVGAPPTLPGQPVLPPPPPSPPPPPQTPPLAPPASSSSLRRTNSVSNSGSSPARQPERRRTRPSAPAPAPAPAPGPGSGAPAYPPTPPHPTRSGPSIPRGQSSYARRRRVSGAKSYPCTECSDVFVEHSQLMGHVRRVHMKLRPYACHLCGRLFAARNERTTHYESMHSDTMHKGGGNDGASARE